MLQMVEELLDISRMEMNRFPIEPQRLELARLIQPGWDFVMPEDAVGVELARRAPGVSIGPITTDAVRAAGITLSGEATTASIAALVEATVAAVSGRAAAGSSTTSRLSGGLR